MRKLSNQHKQHIRESIKKKHWSKTDKAVGIKKRISKAGKKRFGDKNPAWKNGITLNKKTYAKIRIKRRLRKLEKKAGRKKPKRCEVCNIVDIIHFDHDHKTNKFRGWVCGNCNRALGCAKDSPSILRKLADYLEKQK